MARKKDGVNGSAATAKPATTTAESAGKQLGESQEASGSGQARPMPTSAAPDSIEAENMSLIQSMGAAQVGGLSLQGSLGIPYIADTCQHFSVL